MRATDRSQSPLPLPSDRFQHWKLQRDRERRVARQDMAASPLSPPRASHRAPDSAEERRRARRVATHSEEEDELMDMIMERERQEREGDSAKRLHLRLRLQQQLRRRQLPPLPTSNARSRRFTVPMQTAEQQQEDEPAPRRPYGSAPRAQTSLLERADAASPEDGRNVGSNVAKTVGTIPLNEITDRYAFQPASSLRWRSMKPPVADGRGDLEQRKRQEETDADRILEQAAMDSGKRKDLWDNFYIGAKASRSELQQQQAPIEPVVFSTSSFRGDSLLQSPSSVESWGNLEAPRSEDARMRGKEDSRGHHSSTQSSDALGHLSPDNRLHGLRRRHRKGSESANSGASESGQVERALHEELPGLTVRKRDQPESDIPDSASAILGDGLFDPKRTFDEIFPPWSIVFLTSCMAAGVGGFFVEEVMEVAGVFFKTIPFSVSRAEQQRLHERLEGLQKELRGFHSAASEIDSHSQKVFEEVRRHLDKLRSERERHQDMVAKEMHELRRYVLQMTYEMVEQERQVIHQRLKDTVGAQVAGKVVSPRPNRVTKPDNRENSSVSDKRDPVIAVEPRPVDAPAVDVAVPVAPAPVDNAQQQEVAPRNRARIKAVVTEEDPTPDRARVEAVLAQIDQIVNGVDLVGELSVPMPTSAVAPKAETRPPPRGVLFMSWQASLVLFVMIILGGYVGLRLRNINQRRKWLDDRRRRRQQQGRHRYFSPVRRAERAPDSEREEDDREDEWEQSGSEYSVETVALMTPGNSGSEEDDEGYEPEGQSELTSSAGSVGRSDDNSELEEQYDEYHQYDDEPEDRDGMESDGEEETKGEEHYLSDEWDEMEREGEDAQDPPEFVHPSTEYQQEPAPASNQAAVYRMATTEHRFPFMTRANQQVDDTERKSARLERRKFARRYL